VGVLRSILRVVSRRIGLRSCAAGRHRWRGTDLAEWQVTGYDWTCLRCGAFSKPVNGPPRADMTLSRPYRAVLLPKDFPPEWTEA